MLNRRKAQNNNKMKASKTLRTEIEERLYVTEKDYEVIYMARIYNESSKWFEVAVINISASCETFVIRAWKNGGSKYRRVEMCETMQNAFTRYINLEE